MLVSKRTAIGVAAAAAAATATATAIVLLAASIWQANIVESESGKQNETSAHSEGVPKEPVPDTAPPLHDNSAEPLTTSMPVRQPAASSSDQWLVLALVTMAIAMLLSTAISFYLYRWRKILLSNPHVVIPEQQGEWFKTMTQQVVNLTHAISSSIEAFGQQTRETHQGVSNLTETFMTMQQALDEREREIQRLKRGYDSDIFRKFVARFIRVDQAVEDFQRMGSANESGLDQIRRLLSDSFAECNVECFQPDVGSDYREAFGVADNPKTVDAESADDDFKIAEILESGYLIRSAENTEVIQPAKVRIYSYQNVE